MLEKTPKTFNARFEKETHYAIADLLAAKYGRDKTEVVSRAILEARERIKYVEGLPADAPVPVLAVAASPQFPFRSVCKHGGETFGSFTKFATICPECKRGGHTNNPSECPVCVDRGTGAL